jgi:archaellin
MKITVVGAILIVAAVAATVLVLFLLNNSGFSAQRDDGAGRDQTLQNGAGA